MMALNNCFLANAKPIRRLRSQSDREWCKNSLKGQQDKRFDQYKQAQVKTIGHYQPPNYPKKLVLRLLLKDEALSNHHDRPICVMKITDYLRQQQGGLKETEWEMTKKQRQHQTRNRHEDGGMHL
jgi:hypothetical protein